MKQLFDVGCRNSHCPDKALVLEVYRELTDTILCKSCNQPMYRIYTGTPMFKLKGEGFYKGGTF